MVSQLMQRYALNNIYMWCTAIKPHRAPPIHPPHHSNENTLPTQPQPINNQWFHLWRNQCWCLRCSLCYRLVCSRRFHQQGHRTSRAMEESTFLCHRITAHSYKTRTITIFNQATAMGGNTRGHVVFVNCPSLPLWLQREGVQCSVSLYQRRKCRLWSSTLHLQWKRAQRWALLHSNNNNRKCSEWTLTPSVRYAACSALHRGRRSARWFHKPRWLLPQQMKILTVAAVVLPAATSRLPNRHGARMNHKPQQTLRSKTAPTNLHLSRNHCRTPQCFWNPNQRSSKSKIRWRSQRERVEKKYQNKTKRDKTLNQYSSQNA